jgi:hypothetical protein
MTIDERYDGSRRLFKTSHSLAAISNPGDPFSSLEGLSFAAHISRRILVRESRPGSSSIIYNLCLPRTRCVHITLRGCRYRPILRSITSVPRSFTPGNSNVLEPCLIRACPDQRPSVLDRPVYISTSNIGAHIKSQSHGNHAWFASAPMLCTMPHEGQAWR